MKARAFLVAGIGLLILAPAIFVGALLVDRKMGRTVLPVSPHEADVVEMNRAIWEKGQPVPDIYGVPASHTVRLLNPDKEDLIVPEEDPSLTLFKTKSDSHTMQAQSVYYVAKMAGTACVPLGLLCLVGWGVCRVKRRPV